MKKAYTKPTVRVVALHARQQLLTVSGEISGYGKSGSGFSQDEGGSGSTYIGTAKATLTEGEYVEATGLRLTKQ